MDRNIYLWKQVAQLPYVESEPCLIIDDLNEIANPTEEESNNKVNTTGYIRFNQFIQN